MGKKERFYIVWDADEGKPIDTKTKESDAMKLAQDTAKERLGSTIVVFEPKEAFVAEAQTRRIYLDWPTEVMPEAPPPPVRPEGEEIQNNYGSDGSGGY